MAKKKSKNKVSAALKNNGRKAKPNLPLKKIKQDRKKNNNLVQKKSRTIDKPLTISSEKHEIWKKNFILAGIVILLVILNTWFYLYGRKSQDIKNAPAPTEVTKENVSKQLQIQDAKEQTAEERKKAEEQDATIKALADKQELEKWKTYKNTIHGFQLKYPDSWPEPVNVKRVAGEKFLNKVSFRNTVEPGDNQKGFDIVVYKSSVKDGNLKPRYGDNIIIKESAASDFGNCLEPGTREIGPEKYLAIEVVALKDDPCFNETYFFNIQRNGHIYDIVPSPEGGKGYPGYDGEKKVNQTLPEFNRMLSTFELLQTTTVKKAKVVPRITAPKPVAKVKIVNGKMMCAKKNDKPHKSKQHKKKHMDMECCLDPDEVPNPWCTY